MTATRLPEAACPNCKKVLSAATSVAHEHPPQTDDFSVCIYCATPLRFNADGTLRPMVDDDLKELTEPQQIAFRLVVEMVHARIKK